MIISFLRNNGDYATKKQQLDINHTNKQMTFDRLAGLLDNHHRESSKDYAHYIYGCGFKSYDQCITTTKKGYELTYPEIAKVKENVSNVSCLMLDYDNDNPHFPYVSIDSFLTQAQTSGLKFYLYTSSSHSESKHKFRVIIPLVESVDPQDIFNRRQALMTQFTGLDLSCFARLRGFAMPVIVDGRKVIRHKCLNGSEFNLMVLPCDKVKESVQVEKESKSDDLSPALKDLIIKGYNNSNIVKSYQEKFGLVVWAYHNGFCQHEAFELYLNVNASNGVREHFITFWQDARSIQCQKSLGGILSDIPEIKSEFYAIREQEKEKKTIFTPIGKSIGSLWS